MRRYFSLWRHFTRFSLLARMEYKANFVIDMVVEVGWSLVTLLSIEVIFYQVNDMNGWSKGEVVFVYGMYRLSSAISTILLRSNIFRFPYLINSGDFDLYLTKPVNPLFMAMFRLVSLDRIMQVVVSVIILYYAGTLMPPLPVVPTLCLMLLLVPLTGFIRTCMEIITVTPVIWLQKLENITEIIFTFFTPARFPRSAFPLGFIFIFTYLFPIFFVGSIPSEIILKQSYYLLPISIGMAIGLFGFMRWFFNRALRSYQSAGS